MRVHELRRSFGRLRKSQRDPSGAETAEASSGGLSVRAVRAEVDAARRELGQLTTERAELRAERLRLQQPLSARSPESELFRG